MDVIHRLGQRFWFVPALLCLVAVVLAELLVWVDGTWVLNLPGWADGIVYRVGETGSRDILGSIAGSALGVAGTTFSITMAVLALTSSSYGPRLVRNFMADRGNQVVLGVYVATFLYSLLVLRSIRTIGDPADSQAEAFVPHLAVNFAVVLAVLNVGVLVYFIHHISSSIQIATISRRVRTDLFDTIDRLYPEHVGEEGDPVPGRQAWSEQAEPVRASRAGYVTRVSGEELMDEARDADVRVDLHVRPGDYVVQGTLLASVHPAGRATSQVRESIGGTVRVGDERDPFQDVSFAVQQLVELAVRALSPGTNDPFTAINALDDLSAGLSRLAARPMPSGWRADKDGTVRVRTSPVDAGELTTTVLDNIRWYAVSSPAVMHAAVDLVERVGARAEQPGLRSELAGQLALLEEAFRRGEQQPHDVAAFTSRVEAVRAATMRPDPGGGQR
ncbi:DUF2254 domain-containing protein [Ornithinimicrobium avium]|uniref:DUF2254 domain-containing protein n=1 Tax=Ornithinimicrobium avium TaxID=2283195 RepID=A0A345NMX9_9MICO|nr:DUF2254 domain-containing protein [Ornithinimicrobium avium]AXH96387.1 DUF2254 domain-containing protein [Ornithinimicrobium avium]